MLLIFIVMVGLLPRGLRATDWPRFTAIPFPTCGEIVAFAGPEREAPLQRLDRLGPRFQEYIDGTIAFTLRTTNWYPRNPFALYFPLRDELVREALNLRFRQIDSGSPFSTEKFRARLMGEPVYTAIVLVHATPTESDVEPLVRWLDQDRFRDAPRLFLSSMTFRLYSKLLLERATLVQYSELGQFQSRINASTIYLVGGAFGVCLSNALFDLLDAPLETRDFVTVRMDLHQIYGSSELEETRSRGNIGALTWTKIATTALFGEENPSEGDSRHPERRLLWKDPVRTDAAEPTFMFQRRIDGKKLFLVFENP